MEKITMLNGKTHYFYGHLIFNSELLLITRGYHGSLHQLTEYIHPKNKPGMFFYWLFIGRVSDEGRGRKKVATNW